MFGYALAVVPILLIVGGGVWFIFYKTQAKVPSLAITAIIAVVLTGVVVPASYAVTKNIAQKSAISGYKEYWNGWEESATKNSRTCHRDGGCVHTFQCDPYTEIVMVTKYRTVSDGNGGTKQTPYQSPEMVTRYHSCPYSTQETTYTITTTLSSFKVASNLMTGEQYRWGHPIPGGKQSDPKRWVEVKERTENNRPDPVTSVNSYENFLLGSNTETFKQHEGDIEAMKAENLLPSLSVGVFDLYHARKVYHVPGVDTTKLARYTEDVSRLNGAFGSELQGDLHVVFAPSTMKWDHTTYANTLLAYWQSESFGKNSMSKNTVVVILGVDGEKVVWSDARTGMPVGNESLIIEIRDNMRGLPLDENLLGSPSYDLRSGAVKHTHGALENLLWGDHAYERVSMSANDADDEGLGFTYLRDAIEPSTTQLVWSGAVTTLIFGGVMVGLFIALNALNVGLRKRTTW